MSERLPVTHTPEQHHTAEQSERNKHLEKLRAEKAHEQEQRSVEKEAAAASELAKKEAAAKHVFEQPKPKVAQDQYYTRTDKEHSFNTTMHHVRQKLNSPERTFSKLIHQPTIEKASDLAAKTIVRPSGIYGATVAAIIGILSLYSVARFAGFGLSGSEMPLLLALGFASGLIVEWLYKSLRSLVRVVRDRN